MTAKILPSPDGPPAAPAPAAPPPPRSWRVGHWMTAPVRVVAPTTLVLEAYDQMMSAGIRRLPVIADDHLVGIVTLGDLREARPPRGLSHSIYELNALLARLTVTEVMTHTPYTVTADTPVQVAAEIMLTYKIGGLPVVDAGERVVGIITESDLFRLLVQASEGGAEEAQAGGPAA